MIGTTNATVTISRPKKNITETTLFARVCDNTWECELRFARDDVRAKKPPPFKSAPLLLTLHFSISDYAPPLLMKVASVYEL